MRKIAVRTKKGGVGKTTTAANIGYYFAQQGKKVCLVDCDSQFNLTTALGVSQDQVKGTLKDILEGKSINDILLEVRPNLFIIPANMKLSEYDRILDRRQPELTLKKILEDKIQNSPLDFIIFDCPPSTSMLIDNVICFVNEVWCPLQTEYLSLEGVEQIIYEIQEINNTFKDNGVKVAIKGIIPTMTDSRTNLSKEVYELAKNRYKTFITPAIRRSIKIGESPSHGLSIFEHDPSGTGSEDYKALSEVILNVNP